MMNPLTYRQLAVGGLVTVLGASIQYYTDAIPIGTIALIACAVLGLYNLSQARSGYIDLPDEQLNQANTPEQLPRLSIALLTVNPSLALFVFLALALPTLWLGIFLLLKTLHEGAIFTFIVSILVLGFSLLACLAVLSEMGKETQPTLHGMMSISPDRLTIDYRGINYSLTWFELRDIVAEGSEGELNAKKIILVISRAGELSELIITQHELTAETRHLSRFLQHYRIKAQGRQVPTIT